MRPRIHLLIGLMLVTAAACNSQRPSAPPLQDAPYYDNPTEGFRFFPPEGWKERARGNVPPGAVDAEHMLVEYRSVTTRQPAAIRVSVADVSTDMPLAEYVEKHNIDAKQWQLTAPFDKFPINGVEAVRADYRRGSGKEQLAKEVVAFRRGKRVYFFVAMYAANDAKVRKDLRRAVDSIVW